MQECIAAHEIVSFDVFDTLIFRAVARPTDAFAVVKLHLLASDAALRQPQAVDAFPELRVEAERRARDAKERAGQTHREVTLDEIYRTFADLSGADTDLVALLRETELAVERDLVYANPAGRELFEAARALGKVIVLCSDMYLPASEIAGLLGRCGYEGYDALYVSCEHGSSKHLGTMFSYVARLHDVGTSSILHIGDNEHGDGTMARNAGCTAVHLAQAPAAQRVEIPWNDEQPFHRDCIAAIVEGIWRKRNVERDDVIPDPWEELGFRVFGPLFTGFLLWLAVAVRERPTDKVLFLARDAYFLRKHFAAFVGVLPDEINTAYCYVSRGSLLVPSLADFPLARLNHLFSGRTRLSVAQHLRRIGLRAEPFIRVARSAGFDDLDEPVKNGDPRMRVLLGKLYQELLQLSAERRPFAQRYIAGIIGDAKNVTLVDVGWVGNIQTSLIRLLGPQHADVSFTGRYVGLFRSASENAYPGHPMHGWLTRRGDAAEIESRFWWAGGVEILEFAMTAPHGTTLGYRETAEHDVVPIIESSEVEGEIGRLAQRLQKGAGDFVDMFVSTFGSIPPEGLDSRAWAAEFFRLVTDPRLEEVALLGDITHGDVAGDSSIRQPLVPNGATVGGTPEEIERCCWKTGFAVRHGLDDDDRFSEALYLASYPDVQAALEGGDFDSAHEHWVRHGRDEDRIGSWSAWMRKTRELTVKR
jgi:predicted HAD superfamily hydrolase